MIFMGTPEFALPSLNALVAAGHDICAVYSQPPRPAGRKMALTPSPIQARAEELGLPVQTPKSLKSPQEQAIFASYAADVAIVAAYGLILPQTILDAPRLGCINVHGSLLPRWRGAAPVQRAILAGDAETGVTIMQMEAGLDTGPMLAKAATPIGRKTSPELMAEIADMGAHLLVDTLQNLAACTATPQPAEGVTYAAKIDKSETHLDFLLSAPQVARQIRAFAPLAWFSFNGERFRVLEAEVLPPQSSPAESPATVIDGALTIACNPGALRVTRIQRAGKSVMTSAELLRGFPIPPGKRLT